jgi:hypothetical protein
VALNVVPELLIGKAVFHRSLPTGGWAYGMPRKVLMLLLEEPLRMLDVVVTRGTRDGMLAAEANIPDGSNFNELSPNF